MQIKAKNSESQGRNKAKKKTLKVKCDITQIKAKNVNIKCEITRKNAKIKCEKKNAKVKGEKRKSQMRNNANKGEKREKRESQKRNNANISKITPKWIALLSYSGITLYIPVHQTMIINFILSIVWIIYMTGFYKIFKHILSSLRVTKWSKLIVSLRCERLQVRFPLNPRSSVKFINMKSSMPFIQILVIGA